MKKGDKVWIPATVYSKYKGAITGRSMVAVETTCGLAHYYESEVKPRRVARRGEAMKKGDKILVKAVVIAHHNYTVFYRVKNHPQKDYCFWIDDSEVKPRRVARRGKR